VGEADIRAVPVDDPAATGPSFNLKKLDFQLDFQKSSLLMMSPVQHQGEGK
jgi:hypothetical protein